MRRGYEEERREKLRKIINSLMEKYELVGKLDPDEVLNQFLEYLNVKAPRGVSYEKIVKSIIMLLCRRYRIPITMKEVGERGDKYISVLRVLNGVTPAKPEEYILTFPSPKETKEASLQILKQIPKHQIIGKNPRVVAGGCIYLSGLLTGIKYTQKQIATQLKISDMSLRNFLNMERLKELRDGQFELSISDKHMIFKNNSWLETLLCPKCGKEIKAFRIEIENDKINLYCKSCDSNLWSQPIPLKRE